MKIKSWSELNVSNTEYHAWFEDGDIVIRDTMKGETAIIDCDFDKKRITGILKFFGFDIEFIEAPKLTEQEWHFVRAFEDGWVARDRNDKANIFFGKPFKQLYVWVHNGGYISQVPSGMFHFITWESEPWSIADLRKLDKE